ncbi:hypothetical protein L1987_23011 [Smallanthus sonchifolius]|uniref:Uncharacterized protein n=1 Tax=Smallanthus sonchifolius TaxID=185202 RepID=A0ACB9IGG8_9ASTR|nr:hypothetical protein L1987_23011 [Smallanthus sonchifolius]
MESLVKLSLADIGIDVLISSVGERCANLISLNLEFYNHLGRISMAYAVSGMDSDQDGVVWEESDNDRNTLVWYVPFASLSRTTWWNSIYKAVSISFHLQFYGKVVCSGFEVIMVARKSRSGPTEISTQEESEFFRYAPELLIEQDSQYALEIRSV